jgi:hypothetical protein
VTSSPRAAALALALALALVLALPASGCATLADGLYLLSGPNGDATARGTALPVDPGQSWREVKVDREHGLVCSRVDAPVVRETAIEYQSVDPNGYKLMMQLFTGLEAGVFGTVFAASESSRKPWLLVPVGADVAWGVYRSITIKPTIRHATLIDMRGKGTRTFALKDPCPPGAEVALAEGDARLRVHVAANGWMEPSELSALIAFLELHPKIVAADAGFRVDASGAADLVAAVRARERARRQAAEAARRDAEQRPAAFVAEAPPGPSSPGIPLRARAFIRWDANGAPLVSGVIIDFPVTALCQSDAACAAGQWCRDRGDGVPLCFGPRASHPFCAAGTDCPSGVCLRRPDGVGVCGP